MLSEKSYGISWVLIPQTAVLLEKEKQMDEVKHWICLDSLKNAQDQKTEKKKQSEGEMDQKEYQ